MQLFHLVLICEKEVVLVPRSGKTAVTINGVNSSHKTDTATAKFDMSQKEKSELEKGIDWINCVEYYWRDKDKGDRKVSV